MNREEPLLVCGSCGCEISVAEDRDNAGLCDDCEMDFGFDDWDGDLEFDDELSQCEECGTNLLYDEIDFCGMCLDDGEDDDDE